MTDLNANVNDLDLEYKDVVKDPSNPDMQQIAETVPEKYKDKTVTDLIDMHVNLEKVLARQGNEVGQLRRTVDAQTQLLAKAIAPTQTEQKPQVNAERLLNDPVGSVNEVVNQGPQAQRINNLELQVAQNRFESSHPTFKEDVNNEDFQKWVLASPTRSKLLSRLHHNYDFGSGDELWELWDEHRTAKQAAETARQGRINAATTVKPGATEPPSKPILDRQKLADLQMRAMSGDPAAQRKWNDPNFQREYQEAYAEKRVR